MNAEIKRKWVEALRSGRYVQLQGGYIRDPRPESNRHCCLGVLCEVAYTAPQWGDTLILRKLYPKVKLSRKAAQELAKMNDAGATFAELADHIEATL